MASTSAFVAALQQQLEQHPLDEPSQAALLEAVANATMQRRPAEEEGLAAWLGEGTTRPMQLLDLRGSGAMRAGSVAALSAIADRDLSQVWSRHFYAFHAVDGLVYSNAPTNWSLVRISGDPFLSNRHSALRPDHGAGSTSASGSG